MTWILVILNSGIFVLSLFLIKEKYNPLTLFSGFWLALMFLSTLELFNIKKADTKVYLIVLIGVFSYAIGCLIASELNVKFSISKRFQTSSDAQHNINYKILPVITLIISLIMTVYFLRTMTAMLQGYPLNYIRSNFTDLIIRNEFERLAWTFISWPLSLSIMPMGLYAFYVDGKSKGYLFASLLNTILLSICSGGRVYLLFYIIQIAFFTIFTKKSVSFKGRLFRNIALIATFIIVINVAMYISDERQITTSPAESLYSYFTGCFQYLGFKLKQAGDVKYSGGIYFLYSPITLGLMILKNIGLIKYPAKFLSAQATINALQEYTKVGNSWFNAFATCFYYFYMDGGFFGVIIESIIYGYISYKIFRSLRSHPQARNIVLYSIFLITIFTSMVRWQFGRPEFFMTAVYVILLTRIHQRKTETKNAH